MQFLAQLDPAFRVSGGAIDKRANVRVNEHLIEEEHGREGSHFRLKIFGAVWPGGLVSLPEGAAGVVVDQGWGFAEWERDHRRGTESDAAGVLKEESGERAGPSGGPTSA